MGPKWKWQARVRAMMTRCPPTEKKRFTPVPEGTRSPQMFTPHTLEALSKGEEPPIMVHEEEADAFGAILAQLSLKQGLKAWGEKAEASATKELQVGNLNIRRNYY